MKAFEMTYVDLNLPNKQKRKTVIIRASDEKRARANFTATMAAKYKVISVAEVLGEPVKGAVELLATAFSQRRLAA